MPKTINFDANQEPQLSFERHPDGTVTVQAVIRVSEGAPYGRSAPLATIPTYVALSTAQKTAFRDTLVGIFQDLRSLEFPP